MQTRAWLFAIALVNVGFAGCMGGGDSGSDVQSTSTNDTFGSETNETETEVEPEEPEPVVESTWKNASVHGGSLPTGGFYCGPPGPCDNTMEFEVSGSNLQALVVEVAWNGSADAYLNASGPNCQSVPFLFEVCSPGADQQGASPLRVTIQGETLTNNTGTWQAEIWVDSTTPTTVEYTMVASVVSEADPAQDFSKLGG